jgi:hypothetical protein
MEKKRGGTKLKISALTEELDWINSERFLEESEYRDMKIIYFQNKLREEKIIEVSFSSKKVRNIKLASEKLSSFLKFDSKQTGSFEDVNNILILIYKIN